MNLHKILALSMVLSGTGAWAQSHPGARYGARDPAVCASTKDPSKGALSAAQAQTYFLCGVTGEKEGNDVLYLISGLKIQVAPSSRPFNSWTDSVPDIDPNQPVYSIRGSYTAYTCYIPGQGGAFGFPMGKNCTRADAGGNAPFTAAGFCYKDSFGDWHCRMQPKEAPQTTAGQPAPGK